MDVNLLTIFITGLFVGGLTCMAVQGGLLAATIAQREETRLEEHAKTTGNAVPIFSFLVTKILAYTILGFLLGWLGSFFTLSLNFQIVLQIAVALFMIATALNLLEVHPIFRYAVIQPPTFLTRLIRKQAKRDDIFAPALLGAFTIFIPCGTTQAMMALAVASGSAVLGAVILFVFILGTSPLFFALGYLTTKLTDSLHKKFLHVAAYAIILLALFNINNAIALTGTNYTPSTLFRSFWCTVSICQNTEIVAQEQTGPVTEQTITISEFGYTPSVFSVKAGSQVTLHMKNSGGGGCAAAFTIPSLGIQKVVGMNTTEDIVFTAPGQTGDLPFMCSMGMYRGTIKVI